MDNRHLSPRELDILRRKIVRAVIEKGFRQSVVAELYGFTAASVNRYVQAYRKEGDRSFEYKVRGRARGSMCKLSQEEQSKVTQLIEKKTPDELGLECVLWTRKAVREYIQKKYGITYALRSMSDILNRWGFTPQKPLKVAIQKDLIRVQRWLDEDYQAIKDLAKKEDALIYWGDEMGLSSTDQRGRTYGKKGKTPVIRKTGSRFRCNMIAAISNQGTMKWKVFDSSFTVAIFMDFLRRLTYKSPNKIFLIVDNHKVHHAKKINKWLAKYPHRIQLFYLPPYSPEMNPQELVNQEIKGHASNFKLMTSMEALTKNLRRYLNKIQFNPLKIKSYFQKKSVSYAA